MAAEQDGYRLYQDLAAWWPLISPPEEYAEEAAFAGRLLRRADRPVRAVLELGSGGGHCASHLAPGFSMTLVDLSPGMLAVSRRLNPDCEHIEAGYGLAPAELARRLAGAEVVGCNLEDSDPVTRELADPGRQADYLAALHAAAGEALVINARVDVFVRPRPAGAGDAVEDAVERGRRYLEAGADCCYPILAPLAVLPGLVADIGGPVGTLR